VLHAGRLLEHALLEGNKLFFFGNGGSFADAQHLCAEFVGRFEETRAPFAALALGSNPATLSAVANDFGFEHVFERELRALGHRGDVAIAISTSGRSPSVLKAVEAARELGIAVVALTSNQPSPLLDLADFAVRVSASSVARIQEAHILIGHVWCELIEDALYQRATRPSGSVERAAGGEP